MRSWIAQLRKGVIELCIMAALRQGETYGYQLLQQLRRIDGLAVSESTVYPILARLTREKLVKVRAAASPTGPPRRYYTLTHLGRSRLREMQQHYRDLHDGVSQLLEEDSS